MATIYEWDYETWDENGDILDHDHADKLSEFSDSRKTAHLVLVRDSGNDIDGLTDRVWAYVSGGKLPEYFTDELNNPTQYKVPQRFHKELFNHK